MNLEEAVYTENEAITVIHEKLEKLHCQFLLQPVIDAWLTSGEDVDIDEACEMIHEAPNISNVTKYGYYETYAVIELRDGVIKAIGKDDGNHGKIELFELANVRPDEVVDIANEYLINIKV